MAKLGLKRKRVPSADISEAEEQSRKLSTTSRTNSSEAGRTIHLEGGTGALRLWPNFLAAHQTGRLFDELIEPSLAGASGERPKDKDNDRQLNRGEGDTNDAHAGRWLRRTIKLFGREMMQPRLTCFYGCAGVAYRYSGKTLRASSWNGVRPIEEIRDAAENAAGLPNGYFNCVLLNWYRNGMDYMGWHSDDEPELENRAAIASVSLGEERRFVFRRKIDHKSKMEFMLGDGSLLIMEGDTQRNWQHSVPKRTVAEEKRSGRSSQRRSLESQQTLPSTWHSRTECLGGESDEILLGQDKDSNHRTGRINLTFRRLKAPTTTR